VTFLEQLRAYLERVARSPEGLPFPRIDVSSHRKDLIGAADNLLKEASPGTYSIFRKLLHSERTFQAFEHLLSRRILETLAPEASSEELSELIGFATTALVIGDEDPSILMGRLAGFEPIARWAWQRVAEGGALDGWLIPAHYAFETRLVSKRADRVTISRPGEVLLELPGVEAVRWLLTLESVQSIGPRDDWRTSPELAAALLERSNHHVWLNDQGDTPWPYSLPSLRRLGALQIVEYHDIDEAHDHDWGYEVPKRARPLLEEIAGGRSTPFAVLARALLHDDLDRAMVRLNAEYSQVAHESVAATTALQARMVVHEVRNALVPAQVALAALTRHLGQGEPIEPIDRLKKRIEAGIGRALRFTEDMLKVANLGDEPRTSFDAVAAVREGVVGVAGLLNGHLRFAPPKGARLVFGPRSRFVLAVVNVLRNAAQSSAADGRVEVSFGAEGARVVLYVDDEGPGVPPEQRRMIFEPGIALRSGGSGQGLALVRQVIEAEMGGAVTCEGSPLGGARFTIDLPVYEPRES
jgi:signal transduction histidine kinase